MKWFNPEKKRFNHFVWNDNLNSTLEKKNVRKQKTQMGVEVSTT